MVFAFLLFASQTDRGGDSFGISRGSTGDGNPLNASLWENTITKGFLNGGTAFQHEVEANIAQQNTYSMMNQVLGEAGSKYRVSDAGIWERASSGVGGIAAAYENYGNVANLDGIPYIGGAVDQGKEERWSKSASTKGNYGECIEIAALASEGSKQYAAIKGKGENTVWKCNQYVYDILTSVGASPGLSNGNPIKKFFGLGSPPVANQWGDPNYSIPDWIVVSSPQAGDVVAVRSTTNSGHVAIMISPTQSMDAGEFEVHVTNFGYDPTMLIGHWNGNTGYVYRRYVGKGV